MQRIANPCTPVRFRPQPPSDARVVELVDTRDLKSLEGNFVPVRVRPRAPITKKILLRIVAKLDDKEFKKNFTYFSSSNQERTCSVSFIKIKLSL